MGIKVWFIVEETREEPMDLPWRSGGAGRRPTPTPAPAISSSWGWDAIFAAEKRIKPYLSDKLGELLLFKFSNVSVGFHVCVSVCDIVPHQRFLNGSWPIQTSLLWVSAAHMAYRSSQLHQWKFYWTHLSVKMQHVEINATDAPGIVH